MQLFYSASGQVLAEQALDGSGQPAATTLDRQAWALGYVHAWCGKGTARCQRSDLASGKGTKTE